MYINYYMSVVTQITEVHRPWLTCSRPRLWCGASIPVSLIRKSWYIIGIPFFVTWTSSFVSLKSPTRCITYITELAPVSQIQGWGLVTGYFTVRSAQALRRKEWLHDCVIRGLWIIVNWFPQSSSHQFATVFCLGRSDRSLTACWIPGKLSKANLTPLCPMTIDSSLSPNLIYCLSWGFVRRCG